MEEPKWMTAGRKLGPRATKNYGTGSVISVSRGGRPDSHAKRIAQLVGEADKRGKTEMVDEAMQWVKSHEPSKQE
jgi:hypothetical protein